MRTFQRRLLRLLVNLAVPATGGLILVLTFQAANSKRDDGPTPGLVASASTVHEEVNVALTTLVKQPIEMTATYVGTLYPFERYRIGFERSGTIAGLNAHDGERHLVEGDIVLRGQTVARLDTTLLEHALRSAQIELARAEEDIGRSRRIMSTNPKAVSKREIAVRGIAGQLAEVNLDLFRQRLAKSSLTAPATSVVSERLAKAGETIRAFDPVLELLDISRLLLIVGVPESRIHEIRLGQPAQVKLMQRQQLFQPDHTLMGEVYRIAESADDRTGAFPVAIVLPNWMGIVEAKADRSRTTRGGRANGNQLEVLVDNVSTLHLDLLLAGVNRKLDLTVVVKGPTDSQVPSTQLELESPLPESVLLRGHRDSWRLTRLHPAETSRIPERLRPGVIGEARIITENAEAYRLHSDWIVTRDGRIGVFLVDRDSVARFVPIENAVEQGAWMIVPELPAATPRVVRLGQHRLTSETPVRIEIADASVDAEEPSFARTGSRQDVARPTQHAGVMQL